MIDAKSTRPLFNSTLSVDKDVDYCALRREMKVDNPVGTSSIAQR
jgi:hypothetical protein